MKFLKQQGADSIKYFLLSMFAFLLFVCEIIVFFFCDSSHNDVYQINIRDIEMIMIYRTFIDSLSAFIFIVIWNRTQKEFNPTKDRSQFLYPDLIFKLSDKSFYFISYAIAVWAISAAASYFYFKFSHTYYSLIEVFLNSLSIINSIIIIKACQLMDIGDRSQYQWVKIFKFTENRSILEVLLFITLLIITTLLLNKAFNLTWISTTSLPDFILSIFTISYLSFTLWTSFKHRNLIALYPIVVIAMLLIIILKLRFLFQHTYNPAEFNDYNSKNICDVKVDNININEIKFNQIMMNEILITTFQTLLILIFYFVKYSYVFDFNKVDLVESQKISKDRADRLSVIRQTISHRITNTLIYLEGFIKKNSENNSVPSESLLALIGVYQNLQTKLVNLPPNQIGNSYESAIINANDFFNDIFISIEKLFNGDMFLLTIDINKKLNLKLPHAQAIGEIIFELLNNCYKYVDPKRVINVSIVTNDNYNLFQIVVRDNGLKKFSLNENSRGGLNIILKNLKNLNSEYKMDNRNGTEWNISIPLEFIKA